MDDIGFEGILEVVHQVDAVLALFLRTQLLQIALLHAYAHGARMHTAHVSRQAGRTLAIDKHPGLR